MSRHVWTSKLTILIYKYDVESTIRLSYEHSLICRLLTDAIYLSVSDLVSLYSYRYKKPVTLRSVGSCLSYLNELKLLDSSVTKPSGRRGRISTTYRLKDGISFDAPSRKNLLR